MLERIKEMHMTAHLAAVPGFPLNAARPFPGGGEVCLGVVLQDHERLSSMTL